MMPLKKKNEERNFLRSSESGEILISISVAVVIEIRQGLQVFDQISLFSCIEAQVLAGVVVINNIQ
jgi:hypothetical protein